MKIAASVFLGILAFLALIFGLNYFGYQSSKFYAPRYEQVRRDTFEQSQSYNDGMARDLEKLKLEWVKATPEQRIGLKDIIIHRYSVYDRSRLTPDLQVFYNQVESF